MKSTVTRFTAKALPLAPLALSALPSAQAIQPPPTGIVYTDPADLTGTSVYIDMGNPLVAPGTGSDSTYLPGFDFALTNFGFKSFINIASGNAVAGSTNYANNYSIGYTVDSGLSFKTSFGGSDSLHNITNTADNYLAVSFQDGNSATHYGWIRVSADNIIGSVTVYDFAYNATPGGSILTGQTSAIPEPSAAAALAGLLAGSAALFRRRQQKQAA